MCKQRLGGGCEVGVFGKMGKWSSYFQLDCLGNDGIHEMENGIPF
jgi:hypothetical protein